MRLPWSRPTNRIRTWPTRHVPSSSTVKPAAVQASGSSATVTVSMVTGWVTAATVAERGSTLFAFVGCEGWFERRRPVWADCTAVTGDDRCRALRDRARAWSAVDPDPETRAELEAMAREAISLRSMRRSAPRSCSVRPDSRGRMGPGPASHEPSRRTAGHCRPDEPAAARPAGR